MGSILRVIASVESSTAGFLALMLMPSVVYAQTGLPKVSSIPLSIDFATDPLLTYGRARGPSPVFSQALLAAIARHPRYAQRLADRDEQRARLREAQSAWLPTFDMRLTTDRTFSRSFGSGQVSGLERFRPNARTDAVADIEQLLFDFGTADARIAGERARLAASSEDVLFDAEGVALRLASAWSVAAGARALVDVTEAMIASEVELRRSVQARVDQGVTAEGDLARIDAALADTRARLSSAKRVRAEADARFEETTGTTPPQVLDRPGLPDATVPSAAFAAERMAKSPLVIAAEARARAARFEAQSARADQMPKFSAGLNAGRYGVFENRMDHDVRGQLTIRYRLNGAAFARTDAAEARARGSVAEAERIMGEARRDAATAWSDVALLEEQQIANGDAYKANRAARDVITTRFLAQRGTLFDVLAAEDAYFRSALSYIQTISDLDTARAVLLARTGLLFDPRSIDVRETPRP